MTDRSGSELGDAAITILSLEQADELLSEVRFPTERDDGLYFFRNPVTGLIKIGISGNVAQRLTYLSVACGLQLVAIGVNTRYGRRMEMSLHGMFRDTRALGEWFHPTPLLVEAAIASNGRFSDWTRRYAVALRNGYAHECRRLNDIRFR